MKPKLILCLALVLSGGLFACKSVSDSRVETQRQQLTNLYQDKTRPLVERVAAFDNLVETIKTGTPRTVLDKYLGQPDETTTRLDGDWWEVCLIAPDGSDRWIPLKGEQFDDQVVTY